MPFNVFKNDNAIYYEVVHFSTKKKLEFLG